MLTVTKEESISITCERLHQQHSSFSRHSVSGDDSVDSEAV